MAETLLSGVHALPKRLLEAGYRFARPELGAVLDEALGLSQKP
jgi:NAD dependent epimerase/dehydratase family enzyme